MRAYELAKEFGIVPKGLLEKAKEKHIKIKSSLAILDKKTVSKLRAAFARPKKKPVKVKAKAKGKRAKPKTKEPKVIQETTDLKPIVSFVDKTAAEKKEVKAMRPVELDYSNDSVAVKEKKSIRVRIKPAPLKELSTKEMPPLSKLTPASTLPVALPKPILSKKPMVTLVTRERRFSLTPPVTVKNISEELGIKANLIIQKLMGHGMMKSINDTLDEDNLILLGLEFSYEVEIRKTRDVISEIMEEDRPDRLEDLVSRPPVVVLMGHVDHGKTTLLDKIRVSNVVDGEAGRITQHLSAYQAMLNNRKITFLDTPGHEAFTNMRARGANVTDIAILVVAADDGVMPQTEEAINHARAANVPVMVAINKMDKKEANAVKVKQQLSNLGLIPEEWGGKTIFTEVSALTEQGIEHFLEMLVLQADIMELKANPKRNALGTVLEAKLTEGKGSLATVLVQNGTLHIGDNIVCGQTHGRIRAMFDNKFNSVEKAYPGTPVAITGLPELPEAGDKFFVVDDLQKAKEVSELTRHKKKETLTTPPRHLTLEGLFSHTEFSKTKEARFVLKADVKGSIEVLQKVISSFSSNEVQIKTIHSGIGVITESDVLLADASDAIIIGFHVEPEERAEQLATSRGVEIKLYKVIYQLADEIKLALEGLLEPEKIEVVTGHINVRQVFKISRLGTVAGCLVSDGKVERTNLVRVKRAKQTVFEGRINSLKRFKDDVKEVAEGYECGLRLDGFDAIQPGDIVETYRIEQKARKLK